MDFNEWMEGEGLSPLAEVFAANHIDEVEILADFNDAELEGLGIPIGSRKKIQRALARLGNTGEDTQELAPQPVASEATQPAADELAQQVAPPLVVEETAVAAPDLAGSASPHHAQATRHEPKAKTSRKATAITVAVGVHVAIILIATTLTIFAASKDEPEIIAAIAPPSTTPQQEMQKKTVQKQVKRAPSAASAAAAPMAIMMKANAEARFTTPEVTRTSTGPLGVGEGDLGSGAFGVGTGLGDAGNGGAFFGTQTSGNLAVIFDVTGSMKEASDKVVAEINRTFKTAHVVCVFGSKFTDMPAKMVTYRSNRKIQESLRSQGNKSMNENMLSLQNCDSLEMKKPFEGEFRELSAADRKKLMENVIGSLGTAMETLLQRDRPPGTIFVFSDYKDGIDEAYMAEVASLAKKKKVKIVIWYPFSEANKFRDQRHYETFVKTVGGELKLEELP